MYGSCGRFCDGFLNYGRFGYGGITMIILGVVLIGAVVFFVWKGSSRDNKTELPLDLLKKRYANGEISEDEYLSKKETLEK